MYESDQPSGTYFDEIDRLNRFDEDDAYWARYDRICDYTPARDLPSERYGIERMARG